MNIPRSSFLLPGTLVLLVVAGLVASGCGSDQTSSGASAQAPNFELETMEGDTFELADHRGRVVVVNFWATWCAPCLEEIPTFVEMQEEYGDRGLQFVGVSLDQQGFEVVRPFARKMEINYPLVVDDGSLAKRFGGLQGVPTTYVVGTDGRIRNRIEGITTEEHLMALVGDMLDAEASSSDESEPPPSDGDEDGSVNPQAAHSSTTS